MEYAIIKVNVSHKWIIVEITSISKPQAVEEAMITEVNLRIKSEVEKEVEQESMV